MPKRPESHQLSDHSELEFRERLPSEWVYRPETPDYGIDGSVEIFESDGTHTGLRFLVQLKATSVDAQCSTRIRREVGEYYKSLELPVLMVLYQANEEELYARWFHEFDPYYGGFGEKTIRFDFRDKDRWSSDTPGTLRKEVAAIRHIKVTGLQLPILVEVECEDSVILGNSAQEVFLRLRSRIALHRGLLKETQDKGVIRFELGNDESKVVLVGGKSATLHTKGERLDPGRFTAELIGLLAMLLSEVGEDLVVASLVESIVSESTVIQQPKAIAGIALSLARSQQVAKALELSDRILDEAEDPKAETAATAIMIPTLLTAPVSEVRFVREFLERRVATHEARGDTVAQAVASYNLGNFLRRMGFFRPALKALRDAAALDRSYEERDYFCREIASLLFDAGFFSKSMKFYEHALRKGGPNLWQALHADATMFAGHYGKAKELFENHFQNEANVQPEWILKHWMLGYIINRQRVNIQHRQSREAGKVVGYKEDVRTIAREEAEASLERDALFMPGWAALAVGCDDDPAEEHEKAAAMLVAATLSRNDTRLWAFSLLSVLSDPDLSELGLALGTTALNAVGEEFIDEVLNLVASTTPEFVESIADILDSIRIVHESVRHPKEVEVRFVLSGSEYRTLRIRPEEQWDLELD